MKKYRHIAWDWNGTLMDDVWLSLHIINALLVRRGIATIDVERYREVFGLSCVWIFLLYIFVWMYNKMHVPIPFISIVVGN